MSSPTLRVLVVAVALVMAAGAPGRAQTVFQDGDFDPANWTLVEIDQNEGGTATGMVVADGNPGNALRVTLELDPAPGFSQVIGVWLWHEAYDPAVTGGFASIDYAEQARRISRGQATGLAVRQNGSIYTLKVSDTGGPEWTPFEAFGLTPASGFRLVSGPGGGVDFSATGGAIEVGFLRANSASGAGTPGVTSVVDIDNWSVTLQPGCVADGDCDDGDACTVDRCVDGICLPSALDCDDGDACTVDACDATTGCTSTPLDCDDGNDCTADTCVAGACMSVLAVDFATIDARLEVLLTRIAESPCGAEEVVKRAVKKLKKRLKKARKRLAKASRTTRERKVGKLIASAQRLLGLARLVIGVVGGRGLISPACAGELTAIITEIETCVGGLPQAP